MATTVPLHLDGPTTMAPPPPQGAHAAAIPHGAGGGASAGGVDPGAFFASLRLDQRALGYLEQQQASGREPCGQCGKSRKFFCFDCHCLVGLVGGVDVPKIELPVRVDIVKHWNERNSKSTAVHAKLVAPDHVTIHTFPDVPDLALDEGTVLLYPCDDAVDIAELDRSTVTRVVFVDSTWSQCSSILSHPALVGLRRVKIASEQTLFWRPQNKKPDTHLATIEAIYHFFRQFPLPDGVPVYDGRFDNLLFWFRHQYSLIEKRYKTSDVPRSRKLEASGFVHDDQTQPLEQDGHLHPDKRPRQADHTTGGAA